MKLSFSLIGIIAARVLCTPVEEANRAAAVKAECGDLGVMDWDRNTIPNDIDATDLRKCRKHPSELGISSPLENPDEKPENLDSSFGKEEDNEVSPNKERVSIRGPNEWCSEGGRGHGFDYDYGCDNGWCWRNCEAGDGAGFVAWYRKRWCWLAYDGGWGDWTPCGRWQDCEWSYNNLNSRCGKGNCGACGCGC